MARRREIAWELRSDDCRARGGDCAAASQAACPCRSFPARPPGRSGRQTRALDDAPLKPRLLKTTDNPKIIAALAAHGHPVAG
jgi:hypothetical protein